MPEYQADIDAGRGWQFAPPVGEEHYIGLGEGTPSDYACPRCASRGRTRAFQTLLSQARAFLPLDPNALAVSSTTTELRIVRRLGARITNVSLQGDHGDPECILGIDITSMPTIPSNKFDIYYASCVVDYIPDAVSFLKEAQRVLKDNGVLMFYIQPFRLVYESRTKVEVQNRNALHHERYAQKSDGGETGIPDCRFGVPWLVEAAHSEGLALRLCPLRDPISPMVFSWFMGRKISPPA